MTTTMNTDLKKDAASKRVYGWKRDPFILEDAKYLHQSLTLAELAAIPPMVDLRANMPAVYDQGQLGSCTANALAGCVEYRNPSPTNKLIPSRLFIYYNERKIQGTVSSDSGSTISTGIKAITQQGVCPESMWWYNINEYTVQPNANAYAAAVKDVILSRSRLTSLNQIKLKISQNYPVAFGFDVYSSFESEAVAASGVVPMPTASDQLLGGHAVMVVGYDDTKSIVICRNSWGKDWGMAGYFTMPYAYISNPSLASDFWAIQTMS